MRTVLRAANGGSARAIRDLALIELAYGSGARLSELAALRIGSLNLSQRAVLIEGKGRRQRIAPLTRRAVQALRRYLHRARPRLMGESPTVEALFVSTPRGRPLSGPGIARVVRRVGAKAGLRLTPHDLRRAFATHLVRGGANPAVVREMLGHASYRHLARYLGLRLELPACPAYRRRFG
jgi:integrase/recombinase XerD